MLLTVQDVKRAASAALIRTVTTEDLKPPGTYGHLDEGEGVRGIVTATDEVVMFDEPVGPAGDSLHAQVSGKPYVVALADVHGVVVKRADALKTVDLTLGILAGIAAVLGVAALIALSSWDGPLGHLGSGPSVVAR